VVICIAGAECCSRWIVNRGDAPIGGPKSVEERLNSEYQYVCNAHGSVPIISTRNNGYGDSFDSISWVSCRASPSLERGIKLGTDSLETSSVGSSRGQNNFFTNIRHVPVHSKDIPIVSK
jgi:hypothetical protein